MAGKLKSLGLSGARKAGSKAMRKLFGRESPAVKGGSDDPAPAPASEPAKASDLEPSLKSSSDQAHNHQQNNRHPPTGKEDGSDQIIINNKSAPPESQQADSSQAQPTTSNITSSADTTDDMAMRGLQPQQQQRLPPKTAGVQGGSSVPNGGKENQPSVAPDASIDALTKYVDKLSFNHVSEPISELKPPTPDIETEVDEETKAEQAKNLFFIGEALDMVR